MTFAPESPLEKTKMPHTPGPWEMGPEVDSQRHLVYIPIRRGKLHISTTGVYGRKPDGTTAGRPYTDHFGTERVQPVITAEECRANARLIVQAPDMLAQLRGWLAIFEREGAYVSPLVATAVRETRAILDKIQGEVNADA